MEKKQNSNGDGLTNDGKRQKKLLEWKPQTHKSGAGRPPIQCKDDI